MAIGILSLKRTLLLRKTVNVKAMCQVTQNNAKNSNTTWFHRLINV